jgi:prevent-host-death family protein
LSIAVGILPETYNNVDAQPRLEERNHFRLEAGNAYISGAEMYTSAMTEVTVTTARTMLPALIRQAREDGVVLTRRGKRVAVLVDVETFERMEQALEDAADVTAYDEAMAEEGPNIPWEQVKVDLGLS